MGTIQIDGSTPKLTIGNATAEDATILFDGNAQDFYIALDDSADDLLIGLGSTVGTTPAIAIDENLKVNIPVTTASTSASTGSLTTGGGAGIGADLYVGDDVYLITDSAILGFGADKDTTLTHTDGTGLTLNSTNKLCFNDASQFVQGSSNAILALGATDEIDLTATAVDLNGTLDVSGNSQFSGTITVGVDDTGKDVKFFGATASSHMLWDESADSLSLIASTLGVVTAKDLGTGIHVRTADSSASVATAADELVLENGTSGAGCGISILSATDAEGIINFGDSGDADIGRIVYNHSNNYMYFTAGANEGLRIDSAGHVTKPDQPCFMVNTNGTISNVTGNDTEYSVVMGTERFDNNADFSTPNFTAPVAGRYFLSVSLGISGGSGDITYSNVYITTSNKRYDWFGGAGGNNGEGGSFKGAFSVVADMDASDTALVKVSAGGMGGDTLDIVDGSFFSGCLLS